MNDTKEAALPASGLQTTFSIITATFNAAESLPKTLDSVLNQSYPAEKIEMIVADGGSSDNTAAILKAYEQKFNGRLKWVSEPDNGIYHAFNKGLRMASHDVVNFKGAGDWLENNALEEIAGVYAWEPRCDAVVSLRADWEKRNGSLVFKCRVAQSFDNLWETLSCPHQELFYRRALHSKYGFYNEDLRIAGDLAFFLKACLDENFFWLGWHKSLVNFVLGGLSSSLSAITDNINENRRIALDLLPALKKAKGGFYAWNARLNLYALTIEKIFLWEEFLLAWQQAARPKRIGWVGEWHGFIKENNINRETLALLQNLLFFHLEEHYSWQQLDRLALFLERLDQAATDSEALALFEDYYENLHPCRIKIENKNLRTFKPLLKRALKFIMPYGMLRLYRKAKAKIQKSCG